MATKTGLSATTIYNIEQGEVTPRPASECALRSVFETAGIEFIEQDGIRHRSRDVTVYKGSGCAERFFKHMLDVVRSTEDEVLSIFQTPKIFTQSCNLVGGGTDLFKKLTRVSSVKCVLAGELPCSAGVPPFKFRVADEDIIGAESCFTYGNYHALIIPDGSSSFSFIVISSYNYASSKRKSFTKLWNRAGSAETAQWGPAALLTAYA